jgi:hypothetical protein
MTKHTDRTMSDREIPATSWAVWAWQAYRDGRLVEADSTEELTAMRNTMSELWAKESAEKNVLAGRCENLEAKLAKLERAAKPFAAIKIKDGMSQPGEIGRTDVTNIRAAIAELKGQDDE